MTDGTDSNRPRELAPDDNPENLPELMGHNIISGDFGAGGRSSDRTSAPHQRPLWDWMALFHELEVKAYRSKHTRAAKENDLRQFLEAFESEAFGGSPGRPVGEWTRPLTVGFLSTQCKAASTATRRLTTLRQLAHFILDKEPEAFQLGDPVERIQWPKRKDPDWRGLTDLEVRRLLGAAEDRVTLREGRRESSDANNYEHRHAKRDLAILRLLLGTALRVSELCSLDLGQYDDGYLRDVVRKGGRPQDIYVPAEARRAVDSYLAEEEREQGPLFISQRGSRIHRKTVWYSLKKIAECAGEPEIEVSPHVLRHTALRKVSRRASLESALRLSGHSPKSGTRYILHYTQASKEELERDQEDALSWEESN